MTKIKPVQLKAHGAALGGGTGVGLAGLVVGLVQQHLTHGPLANVDVQAIYAAVSVAGAFYGAWLLPLLPRPATAPTFTVTTPASGPGSAAAAAAITSALRQQPSRQQAPPQPAPAAEAEPAPYRP